MNTPPYAPSFRGPAGTSSPPRTSCSGCSAPTRAGPWTTTRCRALAGTDRVGARRLLDPLCRGHLVEEDTAGRFGMHDLLRAYAAEKATELPDLPAALTRLADYYTQAAQVAVNTALGERARDWLDRERPHLLAIAPGRAGQLSQVLAGYLDTAGHYADGVTLHTLALKEAAGDPHDEATALNLLGVVRRRLGDYGAATEHHQSALELHKAAGDQAGQAAALHGLGILAWRLGHYLTARERLEQAYELFTVAGDRVMQGTVLYGLGTVHLQLGLYREAVDHHLRALELHRETGNLLGESRTLNNLGNAYERLGRLPDALDHFRRSQALNRQLGNQLGVAVAHTNLGGAYTRLGEYDAALAHLRAAVPIYAAAGYRIGDVDSLCAYGLFYLRFGQHDQALDHLRRAVALSQELGELDVQTRALVGLGDTLRQVGRRAEAQQQQYDEALARADETGDRYARARAQVGLARLYADEPEARQHWEAALALYTELDLPAALEIRVKLGGVEQGAD
ncbi:tetratricopeptide repeat protein [Fodinicola feengrottensis]|uniref:tetratricopeptide repeat protein n=1 Tax=Fodinicola feengrottensis TaxID=435914 RepID=UPI0013CFA16A|nr:tetratricopeptide repeat protein [Fodinicola feengrottensis]